MDSLMAVELRNTIADAVGRALSPTLVFDYPTIEAIANYLNTEVLRETADASGPQSAALVDMDAIQGEA